MTCEEGEQRGGSRHDLRSGGRGRERETASCQLLLPLMAMHASMQAHARVASVTHLHHCLCLAHVAAALLHVRKHVPLCRKLGHLASEGDRAVWSVRACKQNSQEAHRTRREGRDSALDPTTLVRRRQGSSP